MRELSTNADWVALLTHLGSRPTAATIPASTSCPLCRRGELGVYHDPRLDSQWFFCPSCRWSGHAVDLFCAVKGCDPDAAIAEMTTLRLLAGTGRTIVTIRRHDATRHALSKYAKLWGSRVDEPELAQEFCAPLGQAFAGAREWLKTRDMLRVLPRAAFKELASHATALPTNWSHIAAVALEDLPGRTADLWLCRHGETRTLEPRGGGVCRYTTLMGLGDALAVREPHIVASEDLAGVVTAQLRSFQQLRRTLPLVGLHFNAEPSPVWSQIGRKVVFWSPAPSPQLIREAAWCNGLICTSAADQANALSMAARIGEIVRLAKPWSIALERLVDKQTSSDAVEFLKQAQLRVEQIREFLETCRPALRDRLLPFFTRDPDTVEIGGQHFRRDGNVIRLQDRLVSDVVPLVREVRCLPNNDLLYRGEMHFRRVKHAFSVRASQIPTGAETMRWVNNFLWGHGAGVAFVEERWRTHLMDLGIAFGNPVYHTKTPPIGWHAPSGELVLANHALAANGESRTLPTRKLSFGRIGLALPLSAGVVAALDAESGTRALLPAVAYTVAALLSRRVGCRPPPMILLGPGIRPLMPKLLSALDWPTAKPQKLLGLDRIGRELSRHSWPVYTPATEDGELIPSAVAATPASFVIHPRQDFRGLTFASHFRGPVIDAGTSSLSFGRSEEFVGDVLPAYLQDLARRQFALQPGQDAFRRAYLDVIEWWQSLGGTLRKTLVWNPKTWWYSMLTRLLAMRSTQLSVYPYGFDPKTPREFAIEVQGDYLYLRQSVVDRLAIWNSLVVDAEKLRLGLLEEGHLQLENGLWRLPASILGATVTLRKHAAS